MRLNYAKALEMRELYLEVIGKFLGLEGRRQGNLCAEAVSI